MKYFLILIIILSYTTCSLVAQNSIEGKVYDENTDEPLIGATVYFPDLKIGGATDVDGFYKINFIPAGRLFIQVEYVGYSTLLQNLEIEGTTKVDFRLRPSVTELHEVIVTGLSSASEAASDPISHEFVNNEMLNQGVASNVVDAIANRPGINQITTGNAIAKPVVRGLGYNRVVTLNNGQPQEGQQWGDEHGLEIDGSSVDRVEIIKGPGSLMYGSDAMAGVINFLQPKPVFEGEIKGLFSSLYQSNSNLFGSSLYNAGNINGFSWQLNLSGKESGNYRNETDGRVFNSAFEEFNFNGYAGINRKWGFSHFSFSRFNQWLGLIEGERNGNGQFLKNVNSGDSVIMVPATEKDLTGKDIFAPKQNVNHLAFSLNNSFFLTGDSRLSVFFGYQQNRRKEFEEPSGSTPDLFFDLKTFNYDLKYFLPAKSNWEPTLGVGGKYQVNRNLGEEVLIPEYNSFDIGIFSVFKRAFNKITISGGLRYDLRLLSSYGLYFDLTGNSVNLEQSSFTKFSAFDKTFNSYSGSIGATYSPSDLTFFKINISRGFRAPNIAELASNGVHEGTFRYEIGNSNLDPENSIQTDVGFHYHGDHFSLEVGTFYNFINNYIFIEKLASTSGGDSIPDLNDPVPAYQFLQSQAALYGGELIADIHPHPADWLHFENSIAVVYAKQLGVQSSDSTRYLPQIPAHVFRSMLSGDFEKFGGFLKNLFIKFGMSYTFRQERIFSAYNTETPTEDYILVNTSAGADLVNGNEKTILSIVFSIENLFDTVYQSHLNRLKYAPENPLTGRMGIFDTGRNISLKIRIPFDLR